MVYRINTLEGFHVDPAAGRCVHTVKNVQKGMHKRDKQGARGNAVYLHSNTISIRQKVKNRKLFIHNSHGNFKLQYVYDKTSQSCML